MKKLIAVLIVTMFVVSGCTNQGLDSQKSINEEILKTLNDLQSRITVLEQGNSNTSTNSSPNQGQSSTTTNNTEQQLKFTTTDSKIQTEEVIAEIIGVEVTNEIGKNVSKGKYIILHFKVENLGKNQIYINYNSFKLIDREQRIFPLDYDALIRNFDRSKQLEELVKPGFDSTGYIVFEVPQNAEGFKLEMKYNPDDRNPRTRTIELGVNGI